MGTAYPTKIEAALLYDRPTQLDLGLLLKELNGLIAPSGIVFSMGRQFDDGLSGVFFADDFYVLISQNRKPLAPQGFRGALASSFVNGVMPEAADVVRQHRANVFVTVSYGFPMVDNGAGADSALLAVMREMVPAGLDDPAVFQFMANVLMSLVGAISGHAPARALHWLQSDQLMPGDRAAAFCRDRALMLLMVRPDVVVGADAGGRAVASVQTLGARHLIGCEVAFETVPIDPGQLINWTMMFILMCQNRLIPDKDTFGTADDLVIRVLHGPDRTLPGGGRIRLVLEYSKNPPYGQPPTARQREESPSVVRDDLQARPWTPERGPAPAAGNSSDLVRRMRNRMAVDGESGTAEPARHSMLQRLRRLVKGAVRA